MNILLVIRLDYITENINSTTFLLLNHTGSMKVITTFSHSSSVLSSTKCKLMANSELEFLVVGKLDRLDVYSLQSEGLKLECGLQIWGRIVAIKALPADVSLTSAY